MEAMNQRDRTEVRTEIQELGKAIRAELNQHNTQAEERASQIHSRINALLGPVESNKQRIDDHIRNHFKGAPS
jgi:ElaB/YqjD/DUF883 family membrane-anchored ribosome-binding protein